MAGRREGRSMKRYLIFAAIGPLLGGFWLLLTSTITSEYWSHPPNVAEVTKLVTVFVTTLQYSYLFGVLPALMIGAVDDILFHIKRVGRFHRGRINVWLARPRQRRASVRVVRAGRLHSRRGLVVAGAQIRRGGA